MQAEAALRFADCPAQQPFGMNDPVLQGRVVHSERGRGGAQARGRRRRVQPWTASTAPP